MRLLIHLPKTRWTMTRAAFPVRKFCYADDAVIFIFCKLLFASGAESIPDNPTFSHRDSEYCLLTGSRCCGGCHSYSTSFSIFKRMKKRISSEWFYFCFRNTTTATGQRMMTRDMSHMTTTTITKDRSKFCYIFVLIVVSTTMS